MAQIFPKWTLKLPLYILIAVGFLAVNGVAFIWYYGSPMYTDVGYRPKQPVAYSHKLHAGDLGMDCRYCHTGVERSAVAGVPPTETCMNCHKLVLPNSELIAPVKASFDSGDPIEWVRVHKSPDFVYFDHSIHLRAGVGCESCHGNVRQMEVIEQKQPLSMGWCLDCHRSPEMALRRPDQVTVMDWVPPADQQEFAKNVMARKNIAPPEDCSACHR